MTFTKEFVVEQTQSAKAMGSGTLDVLATPSAVAMAENTCMQMCDTLISEEETTVGTQIDFNHLKASSIGAKILVTAELSHQEDRKIEFNFSLYDKENLVAEGKHTRFIVNKKKFMSHIE